MTERPDANERLEAALSSAEPYIEDDGFTDRVLAKLPPRRVRLRARVILGAALLGFFACSILPPAAWLRRVPALFAGGHVPPAPLLVAVVALLGVILWSSLTAAQTD